MKNFKRLSVLLATLAVMGLAGCGASKEAKDAARAMGKFSKGFSGSSSTGAVVHPSVMHAARMAIQEAEGQAWLARFNMEKAQQEEFERSGVGATACSSTSYFSDADYCITSATGCPTGFTAGTSSTCIGFTMTAQNADSYTCDGTTYTWAAGAACTLKMGLNVTGTTSSTATVAGTIEIAMTGQLTGGSYNAADVSCRFNFSFDSANPSSFTFTCTGDAFSCTIGGTTLTCSDLNRAYDSTSSTTCT